MKKLIAIILVISMLFTAEVAFAAEGTSVISDEEQIIPEQIPETEPMFQTTHEAGGLLPGGSSVVTAKISVEKDTFCIGEEATITIDSIDGQSPVPEEGVQYVWLVTDSNEVTTPESTAEPKYTFTSAKPENFQVAFAYIDPYSSPVTDVSFNGDNVVNISFVENPDPVDEALPYLEKTFTGGSVVTETKMLTSYIPVTADTSNLVAVQGANETWYVVDNDITFSERIKISGNINLLLLNGKTLTADKGITLEDENILTVYAQSDDPAVMGELIANSDNGNAGIGGCAGKDGNSNHINGEKGMPAGTFCQKGGKVTVTAETGTCIGGGKGGNGGAAQSAEQSVLAGIGGAGGETSFFGGITILTGKTGIGGGSGGKGGIAGDGAVYGQQGGNAKNFSVYAGDITINTSDGVCIGGGNGGDAGIMEELVGSGGGDGGKGGNMSFIGGIVKAQSKAFSCFGGGKGGKASMGSMYMGPEGHNGQQAVITIGDGLAAYSMNDDGTIGEMIVSEDISDTLNNINKVIVASTAPPGPIPDITHIHTPELQEGLLPTYDASGFMPYYKCTDETCGRYFENEACTTEITDIDAWKAEGGNGYLAPLEKPEYVITSGANSKWIKGSTKGLVITANGPVEKFTDLYIDDTKVDESCYTLSSGSTIIELKPKYLEKLSLGTHKVMVKYIDGETPSVQIEITASGSSTGSTQTGDESNMAIWIIIACAAIAAATVVFRRKQK